jgi:hypothetical protein
MSLRIICFNITRVDASGAQGERVCIPGVFVPSWQHPGADAMYHIACKIEG